MANDLNQVILIGRVTRDPELRQIPSGVAVVSFGLAVGRSYAVNGERREETSFFDCTAWGKLGEIIASHAPRGKQIAVTGRLQQRSWEQDGQRRSKVEVVVENMQLLASPAAQGQTARAEEPQSWTQPAQPVERMDDADESIPF